MSTHWPDADTNTGPRWSSVSKHVLNSYLEANNAVLAAMGLGSATKTDGSNSTDDSSPDREVAFDDESWRMERSVDDRTALEVGDYVRFTKPIEEADVSAFATASGDANRLHLEEEFAAETQFGGRIVHGTLVAGAISAALARLPGLTVYLSQDLTFHAPVEIGEEVTAECEIVERLGDDRYRLRTTVQTEDSQTVVDGEAVVMIRPEPDGSD